MGRDAGSAGGEDLEKLLEAVYVYFRGDRAKVDEWLGKSNSQLGGESPISLIRANRYDLLVDVIRIMINELD